MNTTSCPSTPATGTRLASYKPPRLSDDSVFEIHDFLCQALSLFESSYTGQLQRIYKDQHQGELFDPDAEIDWNDGPMPF